MSKIIFQPVKPIYINQYFGENKACVSNDGKNTVISCDGNHPPLGYRSLYGFQGHLGVDFGIKHGQPCYCVQDGVVSFIDTNPKSGLDVRVVTEIGGQKYRHIYEHLMGYQPKVGDVLKVGDLIGWCDNTGYSSGDHLHFQFEIWQDNEWVPINSLDYMENIFALDFAGLWRRVQEITAKLAEYIADKLHK